MEFQQPIRKSNTNLEIIAKLMNSVAKKYDCRIKYETIDQTIHFHGNKSYQRQIVEESLFFFPKIERYLPDTDQGTPIQKQINPMELDEKSETLFKIENLLAQPEHLPLKLIAELKMAKNQLLSDLEDKFLLPKSFNSDKRSCYSLLVDEESIDH